MKKAIQYLSSEDTAFFIHIDKKKEIQDFTEIQGSNIFFTAERVSVYWGEYSGVQAILTLIKQARAMPQDYDYYVLLSGSDYPIRSKKYIDDFFLKNCGKEFINIIKVPNEDAGKPLSRINTLRIQSNKPIYRFISRVMAKLGLAQRDYKKYLGNLEAYAGNTWWALTREASDFILEFVQENPSTCKYFEDTFAPEEMFFHTILGNSHFKSQIHRNLIYEDWSCRGGHPAMITEKHIKLFEDSDQVIQSDLWGSGEMIFARKFSDENLDVVDKLDTIIELKEGNY